MIVTFEVTLLTISIASNARLISSIVLLTYLLRLRDVDIHSTRVSSIYSTLLLWFLLTVSLVAA